MIRYICDRCGKDTLGFVYNIRVSIKDCCAPEQTFHVCQLCKEKLLSEFNTDGVGEFE